MNFKNYFEAYVEGILACERMLGSYYHFSGSPFALYDKPFSNKGEIEVEGTKLRFHFHGGGCDFEKDAIEYRYDRIPDNQRFVTIGIVAWKFMQFLLTYPETQNHTWNEEEVGLGLNVLFEEGILQRTPDSPTYYKYAYR